MGKNNKIIIARFESQLGRMSMNDFVENCVVPKDEMSHSCPNKNSIIEEADVGTNLMMNGVSKRRSAGLESDNSKDTRIIVITISAFLFCN